MATPLLSVDMTKPSKTVERAAGLVVGGAVKRMPAAVYRVGEHTVVLFLDGDGRTLASPATCDCLAGQHDVVCSHQLAAAHEFKEGR